MAGIEHTNGMVVDHLYSKQGSLLIVEDTYKLENECEEERNQINLYKQVHYIVFRNYVNVWLPVRNLVYTYLSKNGRRSVDFCFLA